MVNGPGCPQLGGVVLLDVEEGKEGRKRPVSNHFRAGSFPLLHYARLEGKRANMVRKVEKR